MKIAFLDFHLMAFGGGTENFIMNMSSKLRERGHEVFIITAGKLENDLCRLLVWQEFCPIRLKEESVKQRIGKTRLEKASCVNLNNAKFILRECDVIYMRNEVIDFMFLKTLLGFGGGKPPIICGVHTPIFYRATSLLRSKLHNCLYLSRAYGRLLRSCSAIHVLNTYDAELIRNYFGVDRSKIVWLPNSVDITLFSPQEISKMNNKFKILFVGRLEAEKGVDILCQAIAILSKRHEFGEIEFTFAGSGKMERLVASICKRHKNVNCLGHVHLSQMPELYNSHDIVVAPSRWESFPYACLEPQSCGVPVVAFRIPGPIDVVEDGETGVLVQPRDVNALAEAMLYMFELRNRDSQKFKEMKKLARRNVENKFSTEVIIENLESMFLKYRGNNRVNTGESQV